MERIRIDSEPSGNIIRSARRLTSIWYFVAKKFLEPLFGREANEDCRKTIYAPACRKTIVAEDEYRKRLSQRDRIK